MSWFKSFSILPKDSTYPTNHWQPQHVYHRTNKSNDFLAMFLQHGLELVADGDDEALDHEELGVDGEQEEHEEEEHRQTGAAGSRATASGYTT